tara:strand:- start:160 stop:381 length:222 start_codon:yes stop_codon:yes gene_type:complete
MNDFKIGDFVRSDTDDVYIGLITGMNETGKFEVAWNDGDYTYSECEKSMFPYEIQPNDWTPYLYKAFSDFFCP